MPFSPLSPEGLFPLLMLVLSTLFVAGVTLDSDTQQRRAARRRDGLHSAGESRR